MQKLLLFLSVFLCGLVAKGQHNEVHLIENLGQWPKQVVAQAKLVNGEIYFEKSGFTYCFYDEKTLTMRSQAHIGLIKQSELPEKLKCHAIKMNFVGATNSATVEKSNPQLTRYNYFLGSDPSKWASNAKAFGELSFKNLYPGINMRCYSTSGNLKYDLVVNPGQDPATILLQYDGADKIQLQKNNLKITTSINSWVEMKPYAYQLVGDNQVEIPCNYVIGKNNTVQFQLGNYDHSKPLIIDPLLLISTYSGAVADNFGYTATYDSKGFIYSGSSVLGAAGYPTTAGAFDITYNGGNSDVGITKYDTTGTFRIFSTIIGGNNSELPHSLIVDSKDQLIVFGTTGSSDFPTTVGAPQRTFQGGPAVGLAAGLGVTYTAGSDLFVTKFNLDGSALLGSTYLGGNSTDGINIDPNAPNSGLKYNYADEIRGEVLLDDLDNVYVVSTSRSTNLVAPGSNVFQTTPGGLLDGVIFKLNFSISQLIWSSYLGGSGNDAIYAIDISHDGVIVVSGGTTSSNLKTTTGAIQPSYGGGRADGFLALISNDGKDLSNLTYWGSNAYDQIYLHEFGPDNKIYAFGQTEDNTRKFYIKHPTGFGQPNSGQFITKFSEKLDSVEYSLTFGNGTPRPNLSPTAFLVDNCGHIYTAGWGGDINMNAYGLVANNAQNCSGMPTKAETNPLFRTTTDNNDFHIMVLDEDASVLISGFYFGENGGLDHVDGGTSRFDKNSQIYHSVCASCGGSQGFPTTPGAASTANNGTTNGVRNGCNNAAFKMDFESPAVAADFSWTPASCLNDTVFFFNRSFKGLNYTWDFGDGTAKSTDISPYHIFKEPGVYYVSLHAQNPTACNLADSILKRVVIYPVGKHLLPDSLICLSDTIQLGFVDYPGATYDWTPGTGLSDSTIANPYFYPDSISEYTLIINGFGCIDTSKIKTTVDGVVASFLPGKVNCLKDTIFFTNKSISADKYLWNFGDGQVSGASDPYHVYDKPGVYTVKLYSTTFDPGPVCNPVDSALKTIVIYPKGVQNLPDTTICRSDSVQIGFDPLPGATYKWTPPTGLSNDKIANPILIPGQSTSYLLVTTAGLCIDSAHLNVITEGVRAGFTTNPGNCTNDTVRFTNTSFNATSYYWDFGDGNTSTDTDPKHPYSKPGVYNVYLVSNTTNPGALCPGLDSAYKQVVIYPDSVHHLTDSVICRNDSTQIGYPPLPGAKYKWTPASGLSSDTVSNPFLTPDSTIKYTLVIKGGVGCIDSTTLTLIPEGVRANFNFKDGACQNDSIKFINSSIAGTSFQWEFGDNSAPSTLSNPSHKYTNPGTYTVRLISFIQNPGGGCSASDTAFKQVNIYPSGSRQLPDTLVCRNDSTQIGYLPIPGARYQWFPSIGLSNDSISNPILLPGETTSYLLVSSANGCIDSLRVKVVTAGVRADFDYSNSYCANDTIRFTNRSSGAGSYLWRFGDGSTSTNTNEKHVYATPGKYLVTLIATSASPAGICDTKDTIIQTINIYPAGKTIYPDTLICRGDTVQLGIPPVPGSTYSWTPGVNLSDQFTSNPFFYPEAEGTYTLVSIAGSCVDTSIVKLLKDGVVADFVASPVTCQQDTVFFTNTIVGGKTFVWDFGDVGTSVDTNTYHIYLNPGTYQVKLTAQNPNVGAACGGTDDYILPVTIYPNGRHFLADTIKCKFDSLQLKLDSISGVSYRWSPGFGLSDSTVLNPKIYTNSDTSYTIYSSFAGCKDTTTIAIKQFYIKLIPGFADTLICDMPSFDLFADGKGSVSEFTWSTNLNFSNPLNSNPSDSTAKVSPSGITTYYIRGKTKLCNLIDSIRVIVLTGDSTKLPNLNLCIGDSTLIGLSSGINPGEVFSWTPSTGLSNPSTPNPNCGARDTTSYKLTAIINGCFEYFYQTVNVSKLDLVVLSDTIICDPNKQLTLVANGKGTVSNYFWSDDRSFTNVLNNPSDSVIKVTPIGTGYYYVKGQTANCNYIDSVSIKADYIRLGLNNTQPYCNNNPFIIRADNQGSPLTYMWSPTTYIRGSYIRDSIEVLPPGPTTFYVVATNADGCSIRDSVAVAPTIFSFLNVDIQGGDSVKFKNLPLNLQAFPIGNYTYSWTPANFFSNPTSPNTTYSNDDSTMVYLTVSDGVCFGYDSIYVKYFETICGPPNIYIPNAFTPNGDKENDLMLVRGNHISQLYFVIYDRWGEKVFETTDQQKGWDGTYKGKTLDPAVFVYYLQLTCEDLQPYFEKGNITLIR